MSVLGFSTKKEAAEHLRSLLKDTRYLRQPLTDQHDLLTELIKLHPEAEQKIGAGISNFFIAPSEQGSVCFWLKRIDGTATDFSYIAALNGKPSIETQIKAAFRYAVKEQLRRAKEAFFDKHGEIVPCEMTGEFVDINSCHIDHVPPLTFDVLVRCFMAAKGLRYSSRLLQSSGDCNSHYAFKDVRIARCFQEYHKRVALLRVLSAEANQKNKMAVPKVKRPVALL